MTSHWLLDSLAENRNLALRQASRSQIRRELMDEPFSEDATLIRRIGEALEMVALDLILEGTQDTETLETLQSCSADAFRLFRVLPQEEDPVEASLFLLRASALAVLGEMGADAGRLLRESPWPDLPIESEDWSQRDVGYRHRHMVAPGFGNEAGRTVTLYWYVSKHCARHKGSLKHIILDTRIPPTPSRPLWNWLAFTI